MVPYTCQYCYFFAPEFSPNGKLERVGKCRLNPPKPYPIQNPNGQVGTIALHSVVELGNLCADWTDEDFDGIKVDPSTRESKSRVVTDVPKIGAVPLIKVPGE